MTRMIPKVSNRKFVLLLLFFISKSSAQDCEDRAASVDLGWKFNPKCAQIGRKYPKLCENKNVVKYACGATCNTCDFNPCSLCVDSKGMWKNCHG